MAINFYPRLSVDGGAAGDLDNLDGATLQVNDIAMVGEGTSASFYIATEDSNPESLPDIVVPDVNAGDWNWVLLNPVIAKLEVALDADSQVITNANIDSGDINSAVQVNITDVGGKITATEVNGALQENRILIDANTSHSGGDGSDHSDVADNTTHRGSDGSDHSFLDQDVTETGVPTFITVAFPDIPANQSGSGLIIYGQQVDTNAVGLGCIMRLSDDLHWDTADADSSSSVKMLGLALDADTGADKAVLIQGFFTDTAWNWANTGDLYLMNGASAGEPGVTPPSGSSDYIIMIGKSIAPDTIYFNPSSDYAQLVA
jgi:hypothetical protein